MDILMKNLVQVEREKWLLALKKAYIASSKEDRDLVLDWDVVIRDGWKKDRRR